MEEQDIYSLECSTSFARVYDHLFVTSQTGINFVLALVLEDKLHGCFLSFL